MIYTGRGSRPTHYHVSTQTNEEAPQTLGTFVDREAAHVVFVETVGTTVAAHAGMRLVSTADGSTITVATAYSSTDGTRIHFQEWPCECSDGILAIQEAIHDGTVEGR